MEAEVGNTFDWPEYTVFGLVLALSAGIGIFYGCFGSKQVTNEAYLMGNRQMAPLPVGLSLLCSFVSATTLLGLPSEVYFYGTQYFMILVAFIPMTLSITYFYVPVYFELRLTSVFEYLELRFNRPLRIAVSTISVTTLPLYLGILVYGPSLAISQVTGINHRISVASIFIVCTFYSTIGGLKTVVATDVLQCLIMILSTVVVIVKGISDVGGLGYVWEKAVDSNRVEFFNFDVDPRTRFTIWGALIGGFFSYSAAYGATQTTVQRFSSIATISGVRRALVYNLLGLIFFIGLSLLGGLVIYAKYSECDPLASELIKSPDQLLPQFVMDTLGNTPGLPGLFVAGITCASLSSVSSTLNSIAAVISEDFVRKYHPNLSPSKMTAISKSLCVIIGLVSFLCTFLAELSSSILQTTQVLIGSTVGPTFGLFTLGMFYPFANSKGGVIGFLAGVFIAGFISLGGLIDSNIPNQKLMLSTAGCLNFNSTDPILDDGLYWKEKEYSFLTQIFSISYLWVSTIGCLTCFCLGAFGSLFFQTEPNSLDERCISPPLLSLWKRVCPKQLNSVLLQEKNGFDSNRNTIITPSNKSDL